MFIDVQQLYRNTVSSVILSLLLVLWISAFLLYLIIVFDLILLIFLRKNIVLSQRILLVCIFSCLVTSFQPATVSWHSIFILALLPPKIRKLNKIMTKNECNNEKVHEAANYLKSLINFSPKIGIICGSGLSGLGEDVKDKIIVKYHDIPHYATSTGKLLSSFLKLFCWFIILLWWPPL